MPGVLRSLAHDFAIERCVHMHICFFCVCVCVCVGVLVYHPYHLFLINLIVLWIPELYNLVVQFVLLEHTVMNFIFVN